MGITVTCVRNVWYGKNQEIVYQYATVVIVQLLSEETSNTDHTNHAYLKRVSINLKSFYEEIVKKYLNFVYQFGCHDLTWKERLIFCDTLWHKLIDWMLNIFAFSFLLHSWIIYWSDWAFFYLILSYCISFFIERLFCDKYYSCSIYFNFVIYILYFMVFLSGQAPE